jgi:outer membrane protein OmpA-like peptidoglycan-associated protein
MTKKLRGALLACAAVWASEAAAVNTENYDIPYLGALGSFVFPDSVRSNDMGYGYHIILGVPLSDWFPLSNSAIELNFFDNNLEREIDGQDNFQTGVMVDLVKDFGLYGWPDSGVTNWLPDFKPFVLLGVGAIQDDANGDKNTVFGLEGGGGVIASLPWWGWAIRADARLVSQVNDKSAPEHDFLLDYRVNVGLQIPLTPFFDRTLPVAPAKECDVAVVDPVTGRSDCATDSDRDGVPDGNDRCPGTVPGSGVDASGCAVGQAMVFGDVRFLLDSADLTADATHILDGVVQTLNGQKGIALEIGGYTDDTGGEEYNQQLSQKRAEAVRDYLVSKGIDASRLKAVGYGQSKPLVANNDIAGREINRRVEFKILSK